MFIQEIN